MLFALFLYNESVMISSLTLQCFYSHQLRIKTMLWHDAHVCYLSKQTDFYA